MVNREAERKRLVELLIEYDTMRMMRNSIEVCADHLLDNGIVASPVKVGQTVYRIVEMSTGITSKIRAIRKEAKTTGVIHPCEPTIKRFIRCVTVTKNNYIDCCENHGKTVFTSREEAKKALKGADGNV